MIDKSTTSRRAVAALAMCYVVLCACSGDGGGTVVPGGDDPGDVLDMTGTWVLTLNSVDPPVVFDCDEDLVGREFAFCDSFEVSVVQDGADFLPDSGEVELFCDSQFAMSGSSTLSEIAGVIDQSPGAGSPHSEVRHLEFNAGVVGEVATFALARLTLEGVNGQCRMGGSYLGLKNDSR